jgi:predicted metal-dependent hydrolase
MTRRTAALDSQQLALFDALAPPAHAAPDPTAPQPVTALAPPRLPLPVPPVPAADPVSIASVLAPATFRHPMASREIRLNEHLVAYALKRVRRRSIGFMVGAEGLSVNAPKWLGVHDIESALHEKAPWILRKLQEQQEQARRMQAAKVDWRDGTSIPFLGETVFIVLDARAGLTARGAVLDTDATDAADLPGVPRLTLRVGLPTTSGAEQIREAVQSWLQRQARRVFEERCAHFAPLLGVRVTRLGLSSAQTRWGSANADGSIRLNWRLIHFGMPSIDYVVAHELAHLREMNHSPRFWEVVRSVLPDYELARGNLKNGLVPLLD